jgi:pimeloyl-ACP methyl ester carboxylesterase
LDADAREAASSLQAWRDSGRMLELGTGPVFTKSEGSGSPLLLIHGFPTASWDWAKLWPTLASHHCCLTLDMLGFGFSAKPRKAPYSIRAQADLCEEFLGTQGIREYAIVAHDYGDTVAQELLARQNEGSAKQELTRVILLNGGLFPETHHAALIQKLLASPIGPLIARLTTYEKFGANMRKICVQPLTDEELDGMWQLMNFNEGIHVMPSLIGYIEERRTHRERWVGALQQSKVPIRLINGLRDPISGQHMVTRYRELVPNSDVIELKDVGHYPQLEAADSVKEAILDFLRGRAISSPREA